MKHCVIGNIKKHKHRTQRHTATITVRPFVCNTKRKIISGWRTRTCLAHLTVMQLYSNEIRLGLVYMQRLVRCLKCTDSVLVLMPYC